MEMIREFFGFGGYTRPAEGFLSWQHLAFVSALVAVMIFLAIWLGKRNRKKSFTERNRVLIVAAIVMDACEIFKIVLLSFRSGDPMEWQYNLPLFLCSIQLIALPMAAFCRGRLKDAALDFVLIFGLLGAIMGTYGAGNNYGSYPVLCFDNVISGITHTIAGFASLYIMVAQMASMKRKNIPITYAILLGFCTAAYIANHLISYNYMFLMQGDGTPYDIFYNLVDGHPVLYPLMVVALFLLYIAAFYLAYYRVPRRKEDIGVLSEKTEEAVATCG